MKQRDWFFTETQVFHMSFFWIISDYQLLSVTISYHQLISSSLWLLPPKQVACMDIGNNKSVKKQK